MHGSVVCEKFYSGFDLLGQVINVCKEENWTEFRGDWNLSDPLITTVCFRLSKKMKFGIDCPSGFRGEDVRK